MVTMPALRVLPLALLVTGIGVHGFRIIAHHEDAQRGTTFAMFATVDIGATRRVEASGTGPDGPVDLEMPSALEPQRQALADSPSQDRANQFATLLAAQAWSIGRDGASVGGNVSLAHVDVRVVGLRATGRSLSRVVLVHSSATSDGPAHD